MLREKNATSRAVFVSFVHYLIKEVPFKVKKGHGYEEGFICNGFGLHSRWMREYL